MDIVDSLRNMGLAPCNEAADEIERLRAENNLLQAAQGMLKAERDALNHEAQNLLCIIERLKDERDALKAALERIANVYCPNGNLARDIAEALRGKAAIDAAREE